MEVRDIRIADYTYELPEERIAKYPLAQRDACKLLVHKDDSPIIDERFNEISSLLSPDSVLIYNNSRVINARIRFRKGEEEDGALIEVFCLDPIEPSDYVQIFATNRCCVWKCFVGNSKRWKKGTSLKKSFNIEGVDLTLVAERIEQQDSISIVKFSWNSPEICFSQIIEKVGELPIPPYLNRATESSDLTDYQTVYSRCDGSVAAPTAGLHFTDETLKKVDEKGIMRREVTLHVGAGTFQPVGSETIGDHNMHFEFFTVDKSLVRELLDWKCTHKRPIIAVGTTSVRTLESLYYAGALISQGNWKGVVPQWYPYSDDCPSITLEESLDKILKHDDSDVFAAETQLLIAPGFRFRIVDGIITNFHQPNSTLLLLIAAFLGRNDGNYDKWREIYTHALKNADYRFLSYGDACLFL